MTSKLRTPLLKYGAIRQTVILEGTNTKLYISTAIIIRALIFIFRWLVLNDIIAIFRNCI